MSQFESSRAVGDRVEVETLLDYNSRNINRGRWGDGSDVTLDYLGIISDQGSRIIDAYGVDRSAAIPWLDRWKVGTVARHVAATHHVVAEIIRGRPDTDFGLFAELKQPEKDAPEFVAWFQSGTAGLLEQLSAVSANDECWSWYPLGRRVGWWARRMALEAVVHRWDTDAALGRDFSISPDVASDGVDEYLDVFVAATRATSHSPAGPTIGFECSDRDAHWSVDLSVPGERAVSREQSQGSVQICGTAQQLMLFVWGRIPATAVQVSGDAGTLEHWAELIPPM